MGKNESGNTGTTEEYIGVMKILFMCAYTCIVTWENEHSTIK